jgi:serine/threonine-protein kinase
VKSALGRFRIVAELGRGSTSIVYLGALSGRHGVSKLFALKQLRPVLAEDEAKVSLFVAEARLGARLSHPNVAQTLEIEDDGPLPFIVMEYLDGQPLQNVVTTARAAFTPLPLYMHLAALSGAIEGLGYAHAAAGPDGTPLQVVHRDVSPYNVFLTVSGQPKLLDFGIAQTIETEGTLSASAGRAAYMAPELAAGEPVDARADLFSVGVMLWEAATRRRFWGDTMSKEEIQRALASRSLPESRVTSAGRAPVELQPIILRATSPDPADRYESAGALQIELQAAMRALAPATFAQRDMGQRVAVLFGAERARLQIAIDEDFQATRDTPSSDRPSLTPPPPSSTARESRPVATPPPPPSVESPPMHHAQSTLPLPRFPDPPAEKTAARFDRRLGVAGLALAGAIAALGAWMLRGGEPAGRPAATAVMPAAEGPRAEGASAREPAPPEEAVAPSSVETGLPALAPPATGTTPPTARPRPARIPAHGYATSPSAAPASAESNQQAAPTAPVASAAPSGAARPSRPIDTNNPYGP